MLLGPTGLLMKLMKQGLWATGEAPDCSRDD